MKIQDVVERLQVALGISVEFNALRYVLCDSSLTIRPLQEPLKGNGGLAKILSHSNALNMIIFPIKIYPKTKGLQPM